MTEDQLLRAVLELCAWRWRDVLLDAGQDWALWRPGDWPQIQAELKVLAKGEARV